MCNILKRVVKSTSLLQKSRKLTFRYQKSRVKKADFGATQLRTIGFKEITDVLLLNDRKLSHHVKINIDFNLSGAVLS